MRWSGSSASEVLLDRMPAQRLERERRDERASRTGSAATWTSAPAAWQAAHQVGGLVRGDRAGDAEPDEPARERRSPLPPPRSHRQPGARLAARPRRGRLRARAASAADRRRRPRGRAAHSDAANPPVRSVRTSSGRMPSWAASSAAHPADQARTQVAPPEDRACPQRRDRVPPDRPAGLGERDARQPGGRACERAGGRASGPAAIAPPRNAPSAATASTVMAVPTSATTAGEPWSRCAASAFTSRSAPTSSGRSTRTGSGRWPASAMRSGSSRPRATRPSASVSAGTTDAQRDRRDLVEPVAVEPAGGRRAAAPVRRPSPSRRSSRAGTAPSAPSRTPHSVRFSSRHRPRAARGRSYGRAGRALRGPRHGPLRARVASGVGSAPVRPPPIVGATGNRAGGKQEWACPWRSPAKFFVNRGIVSSTTDMYNLLRPLLKQTVALSYFRRGRDLVAHGAGWVERIVVDRPATSSYFTPLAICINVDSFEHLEFETRPDQLHQYTLVQGDESVVLEFAPLDLAPPATDVRSQLRFDTSDFVADGAARLGGRREDPRVSVHRRARPRRAAGPSSADGEVGAEPVVGMAGRCSNGARCRRGRA